MNNFVQVIHQTTICVLEKHFQIKKHIAKPYETWSVYLGVEAEGHGIGNGDKRKYINEIRALGID